MFSGGGSARRTIRFALRLRNEEAIAAYRKFLRGETLIEGAVSLTITQRLPLKVRRIQAELPAWMRKTRRRRRRHKLTSQHASLRSGDLARAEREADALLALIDGD
jgi:hypothetical protein